MMKKAIIFTSLTLSILMILDSVNAGHAVFMFLLAGIIPGTTIVLSPTDMMSLFSLLIGFVLARIVTSVALSFFSNRPVQQNA